MPFTKETARAAGKKSRRGPSQKLDPSLKEKMQLLYEDVLDHLILHQHEISMSDRVKLVQSLSNYIIPKTKPVRDEETLEKLTERKFLNWKDQTADPTK